MSPIQAINRAQHASQRWVRYTSYLFAAADAVCPLVTQELSQAMLAMPIAFLADKGAFVPVAVLGVKPGKNLFVALNGQWVAAYIPAAYRSYPFLLAPTDQGQHALCVNKDSGLLSATEGEPLFDNDGQPSKAVTEVMAFLNQLGDNRRATQQVCAVLQKHQLIQPWPIKLQGDDGVQTIEGLFRIDEAAMNRLPAAAFLELRDLGALGVAYCQLLSMQHLPLLGQLVQAHAKAEAAAAPVLPTKGKDLDLSFMDGNGTFKFS